MDAHPDASVLQVWSRPGRGLTDASASIFVSCADTTNARAIRHVLVSCDASPDSTVSAPLWPLPCICPTPGRILAGMRSKRTPESLRPQEELIAMFGLAQFVRTLDGKTELKGGTENDRRQAQEWIASFWREGSKLKGNT